MYSDDDYRLLATILPVPVSFTVQPTWSLDTVYSAANPRISPRGRRCVFADLLVDPAPVDPLERVSATALSATIDTLLAGLDPRSRQVIRLRFGLDDGCTRTLEEIGQHFGVTRERIRQIEQKALSKLRRRPAASLLEPWLRDAPERPAPREWPPAGDAPCPIRARRRIPVPCPPEDSPADETPAPGSPGTDPGPPHGPNHAVAVSHPAPGPAAGDHEPPAGSAITPLPPIPSTGTSSADPAERRATLLAAFLAYAAALGFEVVDNRPRGGALWVHDLKASLAPEIERLRQHGLWFRFAEHRRNDTWGWWLAEPARTMAAEAAPNADY